MLEEPHYKRVEALIHQEALRENLRTIRSRIGADTKLMAVVKANGYGHGVENLWPVLEQEGVNALAVAVVEEGVALREMGIRLPVLLLGYTAPSDAECLIRNQLGATVFTTKMAEALSEEAVRLGRTALVHIALDTGMGRIGFPCTEEAAEEIVRISRLPGLSIEGMFTHFARADEKDKSVALAQLERYNTMYDRLLARGLRIPVRHVANSAAIMELPEAHFEMVRAGIILYGLTPSDEMDTEAFPLHPVMELKSHVVFIKEVEDGSPISYGGTYVARGKRRIGTIPVGYADGYDRLLSNRGEVLIRGKRVPIAGRICMDQFMVDLTDVPEAEEGDEVTLFGEGLPLDELAGIVGTINYELACQVSARVPRRAVK